VKCNLHLFDSELFFFQSFSLQVFFQIQKKVIDLPAFFADEMLVRRGIRIEMVKGRAKLKLPYGSFLVKIIQIAVDCAQGKFGDFFLGLEVDPVCSRMDFGSF